MNTSFAIKYANIAQSLMENEIDLFNFVIESISAHNRSQNELLTKKIQSFNEQMNKLMIKYKHANQLMDTLYDIITYGKHFSDVRESVDQIYFKIVDRY